MIKKLISTRMRKIVVLTAVFFSMVIVALGITPNYSCGCGQVEEGTKLTYIINKVSEKIIGKPVIETRKKPLE